MEVCTRRYLRGLLYRSLIVVFCYLLLQSAPQAAAQTNLAGYWVLHVDNGDGTVRDTFFELNQDGESITGTLLGRGPHGTPITGTFKDGQLKFKTVPPAPSATAPPGLVPRSISYEGAYQEGKLSLQTENFRHRDASRYC